MALPIAGLKMAASMFSAMKKASKLRRLTRSVKPRFDVKTVFNGQKLIEAADRAGKPDPVMTAAVVEIGHGRFAPVADRRPDKTPPCSGSFLSLFARTALTEAYKFSGVTFCDKRMNGSKMDEQTKFLIEILGRTDAIWRPARAADWIGYTAAVRWEMQRDFRAAGVPWGGTGGTEQRRKAEQRLFESLIEAGELTETFVHRDGKAYCRVCDRYMGRTRA